MRRTSARRKTSWAGRKSTLASWKILVCPVTRAELTYDPVRQELVSRAARLAYPIRDGVPIMLPEEARKLDDPGLLPSPASPGFAAKPHAYGVPSGAIEPTERVSRRIS